MFYDKLLPEIQDLLKTRNKEKRGKKLKKRIVAEKRAWIVLLLLYHWIFHN